MTWIKKKDPNEWRRCQYCGRYISYADFSHSRAIALMVRPDSKFGQEKWETFHFKCKAEDKLKTLKLQKQMDPYNHWMKSDERKQLLAEIKKITEQRPDLKAQALDLLDLCDDEIQEGGSPDNEYELAMSDLRSLLK